jgi:hypothetical protein
MIAWFELAGGSALSLYLLGSDLLLAVTVFEGHLVTPCLYSTFLGFSCAFRVSWCEAVSV